VARTIRKHALTWLGILVAAELVSVAASGPFLGVVVVFAGAAFVSTTYADPALDEQVNARKPAIWACWLAGSLLVPFAFTVLARTFSDSLLMMDPYAFEYLDLSRYLLFGLNALSVAFLLASCGTLTGALLGQAASFALNWGIASLIFAIIVPQIAPDGFISWVVVSRSLLVLAAAGCFATTRCELGAARGRRAGSEDGGTVGE
jgi:hypothetical protein